MNSCASLGYYNALGVLKCTSDCQFDDSLCGGRCGDELVQGPNGETCDSGNLNGQSCKSLGYTGGTLACGTGCTYDVSGCAGKCGNGVIDEGEGEVCDGAALDDETCQTQGYHGGALACDADCGGFNFTNCVAVGRCGDGVIQSMYGEICDDANLDGQTCESLGYYPGTLTCDAVTCQFDFSGCAGTCGDGIIQSSYGESCDSSALGGETCETLGYSASRSGELACLAGCIFDESSCVAIGENADLATLTVSEGTLNPVFSPSTIHYYVSLPYAVVSQTVMATASDAPYATVELSLAQPMTLVEGVPPVTVTVTVTAESGTQKVYTVVITRLSPNDYLSMNIGGLKYVPAGTFQRDETATNLSSVSAFRMSQYEITRTQWTTVTGWADPSDVTRSSGTSDPVQQVSWYDAIAFCNKLSLLEGLTPVYTVSGVNFSTLTYAQIPTSSPSLWDGLTANWSANGYRLPTEMEWMWAAMGADLANPGAVNTTGYAKAFAGNTEGNLIGDYAVFGYNTTETGCTTTRRSNPVGSKLANELGFHDLSGNVWEWAWDWHASSYPTGTVTDHRGPASGANRVIRGGYWYNAASLCTVAYRGAVYPFGRFNSNGFRVLRP